MFGRSLDVSVGSKVSCVYEFKEGKVEFDYQLEADEFAVTMPLGGFDEEGFSYQNLLEVIQYHVLNQIFYHVSQTQFSSEKVKQELLDVFSVSADSVEVEESDFVRLCETYTDKETEVFRKDISNCLHVSSESVSDYNGFTESAIWQTSFLNHVHASSFKKMIEIIVNISDCENTEMFKSTILIKPLKVSVIDMEATNSMQELNARYQLERLKDKVSKRVIDRNLWDFLGAQLDDGWIFRVNMNTLKMTMNEYQVINHVKEEFNYYMDRAMLRLGYHDDFCLNSHCSNNTRDLDQHLDSLINHCIPLVELSLRLNVNVSTMILRLKQERHLNEVEYLALSLAYEMLVHKKEKYHSAYRKIDQETLNPLGIYRHKDLDFLVENRNNEAMALGLEEYLLLKYAGLKADDEKKELIRLARKAVKGDEDKIYELEDYYYSDLGLLMPTLGNIEHLLYASLENTEVPWTDEDVVVLKADFTIAEISNELSRSLTSVIHQLRKQNLMSEFEKFLFDDLIRFAKNNLSKYMEVYYEEIGNDE